MGGWGTYLVFSWVGFSKACVFSFFPCVVVKAHGDRLVFRLGFGHRQHTFLFL